MKTLLIILSFLMANSTFGQNSVFIQSGGSLFSYTGDMGSFDQAGAGFHLGVRFNKKAKLNGSLQITVGSVSDDDPKSNNTTQIGTITPNRYFKTNFIGLNYELSYHLIKNDRWWIYFSQGIGFFQFNPKNEFGEDLTNLSNTRKTGEEYRNISFILPTSFGAIYFLSNKAGLGITLTSLNTTTDYIDNISELGNSGNDNIFQAKFSLIIPVQYNTKEN